MSTLWLVQGWRCLEEVGAGRGSIAMWLGEQVGERGSVLATDINLVLLEGLASDNLQAQQHSILNNALPESHFDLVHSCWLLHHLHQPEIAIRRTLSAIKPGGWLLLEKVDFFPLHATSSAGYCKFMTVLVNTVVAASGRDCFWAREPSKIVSSMFDEVGVEGDFCIVRGGSSIAEFSSLTAEQMRERILQSGALDEAGFDDGLKLLASPDFRGFGGAGVSVWGRRRA
jgi:SAM-dependent methyltransferase